MILVFAGFSSLCLLLDPSTDDPISFSRLRPGREIQIDLETTGCSGSLHHLLVFPAEPPHRLDVYEYPEEGPARPSLEWPELLRHDLRRRPWAGGSRVHLEGEQYSWRPCGTVPDQAERSLDRVRVTPVKIPMPSMMTHAMTT